jgi:hypothetical protein
VGSFSFLRIYPWFTKNTPERVGKTQLGPREWPAAVPAIIRRGGGRGRWGEVGKMFRNSPATDLWAWLLEKDGRRGRLWHSQAAVRPCARRGGLQRRRRSAGRGAARHARHRAADPSISDARHVGDRTGEGLGVHGSVRRHRSGTPRHGLPGDSGHGTSGRATSGRVVASGRCVTSGNAASGSAPTLGARAGARTPRQHGARAGAARRGAKRGGVPMCDRVFLKNFE